MIFLDYFHKLVHDAKTDDALGVGITKCGYAFLAGSSRLKREQTFAENPQEDWNRCPKCDSLPWSAFREKWIRHPAEMKATLRIMARSQVGKTQEEVQAIEA